MRPARVAFVCALAAGCGSTSKPTHATDALTQRSLPPHIGVWALAPANATSGLVITESGLKSIDGALASLVDGIDAHPKISPGIERLATTIAGQGDDAFPVPRLGEPGAEYRPYAAFFAGRDRNPVAVVNPKAPPANMHCEQLRWQTVCAPQRATLDALANADQTPPLADAVAALPDDLRGEIELVVDLGRVKFTALEQPLVDALMTDLGTWAAACRLDGGIARCKGRLEGTLTMNPFKAAPAPPVAFDGLDRGAVSVVRASLAADVIWRRLFAGGATPIAPGIDVQSDLLEQTDGEIAIIAAGPGLAAGRIVAGLKQSGPPRRVVKTVCRLLQMSGAASVDNDDAGCILTAPVPAGETFLPLLGHDDGKLRGRIAVRDDAFWLDLGVQPTEPSGPSASRYTEDLFTGDSQLVMWGRSLDPLAGLSPAMRQRLRDLLLHKLDPDMVTGARWIAAHIAEAGLAVRAADGHIELDARLVTFAADPAPVYHAYRAALAHDVAGDHLAYRDAMHEIATAHPNTLAGRQAQLVERGVPALGPIAIAAVMLLLF